MFEIRTDLAIEEKQKIERNKVWLACPAGSGGSPPVW